ncbi:MAG: sulfotransferase [bacterium]
MSRLRNELRFRRGRRALRRAAAAGPGLKIFVIGCGRSGTHWLAHTLGAHPQIHIEIEAPPVFGWTTRMALDPRTEAHLFPRLVERYRAGHALVQPRHYADKSHPNLWLAEALAEALPEARFIAIRRAVEPTVASMLRHAGTRSWIDRWERYPMPNRFLGISADHLQDYRVMSAAARCALRVIAHSREIERLRPRLGARMVVVEYEALLRDPATAAHALQCFLALRSPLLPPPALRDRADRWRTMLRPQDHDDIRALARRLHAEAFLAGA